jgi:hypothetical protein
MNGNNNDKKQYTSHTEYIIIIIIIVMQYHLYYDEFTVYTYKKDDWRRGGKEYILVERVVLPSTSLTKPQVI